MATQEDLIERLKELGYKKIKKLSSRRLAILTDDNRIDVLTEIKKRFAGAVYDKTPTSISGVGLVNIGKLSILAKPNSSQGTKSAGIGNEILLINAINDAIKKHGPMDVVFSAGTKKKRTSAVKKATEMGRDTSGRKKADMIIETVRGKKIPISIKQDNAQIWESADRLWANAATKILTKLTKSGEVLLSKDKFGIFKISPNVAVPSTITEKENVVFGSDLLRDKGAVIFRTFKSGDFSIDGDSQTLKIQCSGIITNPAEVKGDHDVMFLIRNDKTRNTSGLPRGIRILAVTPARVTRTVLVATRSGVVKKRPQ
jgi:hypothetical protein